ncbi:MAG: hypothetical protein KA309_07595 [Giesbergeria sp.]|nr:hypothetical protein [Giesbergeria sp.]
MNISHISTSPRPWSSEGSLSTTAQPPPRVQSPPVQQLAPQTTPVTLSMRAQNAGNTAGHAPDAPFLVITQMPAALEQSYDLTYGALGLIHVKPGTLQVWEQSSDNAISNVMARNASGHTAQNRLAGLGAALLEHVGNTGASYRQTVANVGAPESKQKIQARATDALYSIQGAPTARVELRIQTQSGATVTLNISDQNEAGLNGTGLSIDIQVNGDLTAAERKALAAMAGGFEKAIQGLAAGETEIDLEELAQFDQSAIASVDFKTSIYGRNEYGLRYEKLGAQFTADANTRDIQINSPEGEIRISVDLRQPGLWGDAAQKAKAVRHYLDGIDRAAERGKADEGLVKMFKSTFSALNATYGAQSTDGGLQGLAMDSGAWNDEDKSWLTGLADFNTVLAATPKASNPRHSQELDQFHYTLSQSTTITGADKSQRGVTQTQESRLVAAYHQSLVSTNKPILDSTTASQNYLFKQVEDSASTQVHLGYEKDEPVAATLTKTLTQSLRIQKFENNQLVQDRVVPNQQSSVVDLLPLLTQLREREKEHQITDEEKQTLLESWNDLVFSELTAP